MQLWEYIYILMYTDLNQWCEGGSGSKRKRQKQLSFIEPEVEAVEIEWRELEAEQGRTHGCPSRVLVPRGSTKKQIFN